MLDAGNRRFLEVERFDRTSTGRRGRLSLGALEDGLSAGTDPNWLALANLFESAGWLAPGQARELRWRWCFGDLIGNSDMHRHNTSVAFGDEIPFRLTPSYDMLPMLYAPGTFEDDLEPRVFAPAPILCHQSRRSGPRPHPWHWLFGRGSWRRRGFRRNFARWRRGPVRRFSGMVDRFG